ncbi:polymorphic toxin type 17 domain-containing protein [Brevibacillus sp. B_LB10_24]|uniref:polymorphic toxin type 17 domain-containing protein n=1 Tax=Brevibacillus sp. B_LB10_24 TaxID=3380645 RepID=UPI0038B8C271
MNPTKHPWSELPKSGDYPFEPPLDKSGNPVYKKGPNGGVIDKNGNEWVLDKPSVKVGNDHWDVQHPDGKHTKCKW